MVISGLELPETFIYSKSYSLDVTTTEDGRGRVRKRYNNAIQLSIVANIPKYYDSETYYNWLKYEPTKNQPMTDDVFCVVAITKNIFNDVLELNISLSEMRVHNTSSNILISDIGGEFLLTQSKKLEPATNGNLQTIHGKKIVSTIVQADGAHARVNRENNLLIRLTRSWRNTTAATILKEFGYNVDPEIDYKIKYFQCVDTTPKQLISVLLPFAVQNNENVLLHTKTSKLCRIIDILSTEYNAIGGYSIALNGATITKGEGVDRYEFPLFVEVEDTQKIVDLCEFRTNLNKNTILILTDSDIAQGDLFEIEGIKYVALETVTENDLIRVRGGRYD